MLRFFARSAHQLNKPFGNLRDQPPLPCPDFQQMKQRLFHAFSNMKGITQAFLHSIPIAPTPAILMDKINREGTKIIRNNPDSDLFRLLAEKNSAPPKIKLLDLEEVVKKLPVSDMKPLTRPMR